MGCATVAEISLDHQWITLNLVRGAVRDLFAVIEDMDNFR
jgi:hypothetical protein